MERLWMRLVQSFGLVEQAALFLDHAHTARTLSGEKLARTGVLITRCPATGKDFSTGILTDENSLNLLPQELNRSHCPHCNLEHSWWTKDTRFVDALPQSEWVEFAGGSNPKSQHAQSRATLSDLLDALVRAATEKSKGGARAAFYIAEGAKLNHVTGMTDAYARHVNGFVIGPQSLACGVAAATRRPIITRDVTEEPLWAPWLWLAKKFDYRACWSFPVETSSGTIVGTFAMYYKEPRDASADEIDFATSIARAAAIMIAHPSRPLGKAHSPRDHHFF